MKEIILFNIPIVNNVMSLMKDVKNVKNLKYK